MTSIASNLPSVLTFEPNDRIIHIKTTTNKIASIKYKKGTQHIQNIIKIFMELSKYGYLHQGQYISDPSEFNIIVNNHVLSEENMVNSQILDTLAESDTYLKLQHKENSIILQSKEYDPSKQFPHQLSVKTLTGKTVYINCDIDTNTVADFKCMVQYTEGVPPDQQRIIFAGRQLEDNKLLSDYMISNNDTLYLVLRLRGGMYHEVSGRDGNYMPLGDVFFVIY